MGPGPFSAPICLLFREKALGDHHGVLPVGGLSAPILCFSLCLLPVFCAHLASLLHLNSREVSLSHLPSMRSYSV